MAGYLGGFLARCAYGSVALYITLLARNQSSDSLYFFKHLLLLLPRTCLPTLQALSTHPLTKNSTSTLISRVCSVTHMHATRSVTSTHTHHGTHTLVDIAQACTQAHYTYTCTMHTHAYTQVVWRNLRPTWRTAGLTGPSPAAAAAAQQQPPAVQYCGVSCEYRDLASRCWSRYPELRPSAEEVVRALGAQLMAVREAAAAAAAAAKRAAAQAAQAAQVAASCRSH